jgi:hypothetical protein
MGWAAAALGALLAAGPAGAAATVDLPFAVLRGLDKITARTQEFEVKVNEAVRFGTLEITPRACRVAPPEEPPENAAFLEIVDTPPGQESRMVFSGWMFSSSPGVSALDHPVLDVWVVRCSETLMADDPALEGAEPTNLPLPEMQLHAPPLPEFRRNQG